MRLTASADLAELEKRLRTCGALRKCWVWGAGGKYEGPWTLVVMNGHIGNDDGICASGAQAEKVL